MYGNFGHCIMLVSLYNMFILWLKYCWKAINIYNIHSIMNHVHPFIVLINCPCMIAILLKGYYHIWYSPFHIGILFGAPGMFIICLCCNFFFLMWVILPPERTPFTSQTKVPCRLCHWPKQWPIHPGWRNPRSQLKIYVFCKTDSEQPKNKSEFYSF